MSYSRKKTSSTGMILLGTYNTVSYSAIPDVSDKPIQSWEVYKDAEGKVLAQPLDDYGSCIGNLVEIPLVDFEQKFVPIFIAAPLSDIRGELMADMPDLVIQLYERKKLYNEELQRNMIEPSIDKDVLLSSSSSINKDENSVNNLDTSSIKGAIDIDEAEVTAELQLREAFSLLLDKIKSHPDPHILHEVKVLLEKDYPFSHRQKYMFAEFGVGLRRVRQLGLALLCHKKSLELAPRDANILFNIARTSYELGDTEGAKAALLTSLEVMPDFTAAKNFLEFIDGA